MICNLGTQIFVCHIVCNKNYMLPTNGLLSNRCNRLLSENETFKVITENNNSKSI